MKKPPEGGLLSVAMDNCHRHVDVGIDAHTVTSVWVQ